MEPAKWADAQRLEGWAGEIRVNLFRLVALVVFYGHHLINVYWIQDNQEAAGAYHATITLLVLAWASAVVILHFFLSRRYNPPALKFVATAWDIALITLLLMVGRDPWTMLTLLYFLVIVAAALRMSLPLIYAATLGSMAAYLFYLGYLRFWLDLADDKRLPRPQQIIVLLALGAAGILAGQVVRQTRRLVIGYPVRVLEVEQTIPKGPA